MRRDAVTREVLALIAGMSARFHGAHDAAAAAQDLTGVQARLLAVVADRPVAMNRIASVLQCEPSNITGLVDRLAARGLVTREPSPTDRRVKLIAATGAGAELAARVGAALDFAAAPVAALTPQERLALRDLLRRISAEDPPAAAGAMTARASTSSGAGQRS
jgi:DNA-binding MarR family transcriptional regulator